MQIKRKFFRIINLFLIIIMLAFVEYGCEPEPDTDDNDPKFWGHLT
jgi:hypothetical protein